MKNNQFHIDFKLNGNSFSTVDELLDYSKSISDATWQFFKNWFSENDFFEVKTSGSTGKPKMIQLKKEFMRNSALATGVFFELPEKTTALLCMSTDYIAGKMMLVRALVLGWSLDIVPAVSNPLKGLEKQYDFSAMVPLQLRNSIENLHIVHKLIVGGGVVAFDLQKLLQDQSTEVYATYGMTETITHVAVNQLNIFSHSTPTTNTLQKYQSHYQVLPNISISQDQRGCLVINAPKVSDNVIITNDVVELISDIEFKWLGRFDTVINSGGIKLHPEEIEKKLSEVISQRFFVAGFDDAVLGEKLILIVEENMVSNKDESSLRERLHHRLNNATNLSKYEIPKAIYFIAEFIETETKKIQRNKTLDVLFK